MNRLPDESTISPSGACSSTEVPGTGSVATGNGNDSGLAGTVGAPRSNMQKPAIATSTITTAAITAAPRMPTSRRWTRVSRLLGAWSAGISPARSRSRSRRSSVMADVSDQWTQPRDAARGERFHGALAAAHDRGRLRDVEIFVVARNDRGALADREREQRSLQSVALGGVRSGDRYLMMRCPFGVPPPDLPPPMVRPSEVDDRAPKVGVQPASVPHVDEPPREFDERVL